MIDIVVRKNSNGAIVFLLFVCGVYNSTHQTKNEAIQEGLALLPTLK